MSQVPGSHGTNIGIDFEFHSIDLNSSPPGQNGRHFADDIFKCIFVNEDTWILINISLKFVPWVQINNVSALVQVMAWRRPGDKPLSEPMMVCLLTPICSTQLQWVNSSQAENVIFHTNETNAWPADALAPTVSKLAAIKILTHWSLGDVIVILK